MTIPITKHLKALAWSMVHRTKNLKPHFTASHHTEQSKLYLAYLGELAACTMLGLDATEHSKRALYRVDNGDLIYDGFIIDVKTETIPALYLDKLLEGKISDSDTYGRRLIHSKQANILHKYDVVLFGAFDRGSYDIWHYLGHIHTKQALRYKATTLRPDGGTYPFKALPIKHSELLQWNE